MDAKHLAGVPLFADLSRHDLERIARWADEIDLPAGRHLLDQGAFPHEFFVLLDGTVDVCRDDDVVATLEAGDFFGEIAILQGERRTASVVASSPVRVAVMLPRDFDDMRSEMPAVAERVERAAVERLAR
jgi:CRP-like cAMP-binding protein